MSRAREPRTIDLLHRRARQLHCYHRPKAVIALKPGTGLSSQFRVKLTKLLAAPGAQRKGKIGFNQRINQPGGRAVQSGERSAGIKESP